jgi:glycosyltransferase involved in cell wall biosynthesis
MNILQVNKFFYEKGGTERYLFSLSAALEERGHNVAHFSMQHGSNLPSPFEKYFVRERRYEDIAGLIGSLSHGLSFVRSKEAAKRIAELLKNHPPDVAHLHNIYHQITPSIIPVLREAGVPIVMTLHDYKLICPNYSLFAGGKYCDRCVGGKFYHAPLTRCNGGSTSRSALLSFESYWQKWTRVYDGIACFLAPSRYIRERFIDAGFDTERVIYLPAFVEQGNAGDHDGEESGASTYGTSDTPADQLPSQPHGPAAGLPQKYILYFGRLSREKGLFILLAALKSCDGASLVMAGEGPERHRLEEYARANKLNVIFTGFLPKPEMDGVIARARAVVLPSESPENAPFTVIEAAAMGVPVIVSNMGGLPELAEYFQGIVFPSGDSSKLAQGIQELWSNDALVESAGQQAASEARLRFDKTAHLRSLEEIYKRVTGAA